MGQAKKVDEMILLILRFIFLILATILLSIKLGPHIGIAIGLLVWVIMPVEKLGHLKLEKKVLEMLLLMPRDLKRFFWS